MVIEKIIFYLILIDSIGANIIARFFSSLYKKNMNKGILKHLPASKGWCFWYLVLVLWVGYGLSRLGII